MTTRIPATALFLHLAFISSAFAGQDPLFEWVEGSPAVIGKAVASTSDLNFDSVPDVLVGAPYSSVGGVESGAVYAYSGLTGSLLFAVIGDPGQGLGRSLVSLGDLNGDSLPDFAVGAEKTPVPGGGLGSVEVLSGLGGGTLFRATGGATTSFGTVVDALGDVNGDGRNDLIVGSPYNSIAGASQAGMVTVHSGADGALLYQFEGQTTFARYGEAVVGLPDVDLDGVPDFAYDRGVAGGNVDVVSGATGQLILVLPVGSVMSMDTVGDLDGDGKDDLLIGSPNAPTTIPNAGRGRVYSTSSWSVILEVQGDVPNSRMGWTVAGLGDIDGDGVSDLAMHGQGGIWERGRVRVYSGATGAIVDSMMGPSDYDHFGAALDGIGDINGDGLDELLLGIPGSSNTGKAQLYLGGDRIGSPYCAPPDHNSTGQKSDLTAAGSISVTTNRVTLQARFLPPGQPGFFLNALSSGSVHNPGGSQGKLCLSGEIGRHNQSVQIVGGSGSAYLLIDLMQMPQPGGQVAVTSGETWYFQFWHRDLNPGPTSNFSNGLQVSFQ